MSAVEIYLFFRSARIAAYRLAKTASSHKRVSLLSRNNALPSQSAI